MAKQRYKLPLPSLGALRAELPETLLILHQAQFQTGQVRLSIAPDLVPILIQDLEFAIMNRPLK